MKSKQCAGVLLAGATLLCAGYAAELHPGESVGGRITMPIVDRLEQVTDQAVVGDGGNNWGGHQARIVRTRDGIFTAFTTGTSDPPGTPWRAYDGAPRSWNIAMRTDSGWPVMATGPSGREPVNLMASPDGRLHIIAWPDGLPRLWSGVLADGKLAMKEESIPGPWIKNHWPYNAAGISTNGDIAFLQSVTQDVPGRFFWGYRPAGTNHWQTGAVNVKQRHCYSYVFPGNNGGLSFTSTRDVLAKSMGYAPSSTGHSLGYVFNRVGYWTTDNVHKQPILEVQVDESVPSKEFPEVYACGTCVDSYMDTHGRMHVLYFYRGTETRGKQHIRHAVMENGRVVKQSQLPETVSRYFMAPGEKDKSGPKYCRLIQDDAGRFYLVGTTAIIPADSDDGTTLGQPVPLDLKDYDVEYSGIALAAPRGGTPPADFVDGVFPTDQGRKVIYVRIRLR